MHSRALVLIGFILVSFAGSVAVADSECSQSFASLLASVTDYSRDTVTITVDKEHPFLGDADKEELIGRIRIAKEIVPQQILSFRTKCVADRCYDSFDRLLSSIKEYSATRRTLAIYRILPVLNETEKEKLNSSLPKLSVTFKSAKSGDDE